MALWRFGNNKISVPLTLSLVTMQQRPKTPKQGATPVEAGLTLHSSNAYRWNLLESPACLQMGCEETEREREWNRKRMKEVWAHTSGPSQKLKMDSGRNAFVYCVTATAPLHQTHGTHLPWWATAMVPQTAGLRGREESRGREGGELIWEGICHHTIQISPKTQGMAHYGHQKVLLLYY